MSTPEVNTDAGPQQVGEIDAAMLDAAAKAGISMPPQEGAEEDEKPVGEDTVVEDHGEPKADPERPEWLPEKFKSVEDMAKAYAELEKKQAGDKPEAEQPKSDKEPAKDPAVEQAASVVEKAGLKWDALNAEWAKGGQLSEESYKAFAAQGVTKELVDGFINGQNAINASKATAMRDAAFSTAGSEEKYMEATKWAATGWSEAEIVAFDKAVNGSDAAAIKLAVTGLMAAHAKAGGNEPTNVARTSRETQSGGVYQNMDQVIRDMGNPLYESDPAFRAKVANKLSRSKV